MNKIQKLSIINKLILISLILLALTNPWSVGYIGWALEQAIVYFTLYSIYVFVAGLALLALTNIYMMWAGREQIKIPKKSAKTPKVKYLD